MKTIKFLKPHKHKSNTWNVGDTPTVSLTLANDLIKKGIATDNVKQAAPEQFKPKEAKEE